MSLPTDTVDTPVVHAYWKGDAEVRSLIIGELNDYTLHQLSHTRSIQGLEQVSGILRVFAGVRRQEMEKVCIVECSTIGE